MSPGKVFKSKVKPEIIQASDSIKDTYGAMLDLYLQQVAVGMGISFQELTTDTRGATFSSSRTTVQDRRRYYQKKQEFVKRTFCQPVYDKFVQWAFLSGFISGKTISDFRQNKWGFCRAVWTPDRWAWVDPLKDMQALIAEKNAGWVSDNDICEQTGKNRDVLYAELSEEKKMREEMGIAVIPQIAAKENNFSPKEEVNAEEQ